MDKVASRQRVLELNDEYADVFLQRGDSDCSRLTACSIETRDPPTGHLSEAAYLVKQSLDILRQEEL